MAFGRLERTSGPRPMSDINMTPLIDVMLVLLVIFMITAPLITSGLRLDLPSAQGAAPMQAPQSLVVVIDAAGQLYIGDEKTSREQLEQRLKSAASANRDSEVHLRADEGVPYGRVAELIGLVQQSGLNRIAFVTDPKPAQR